MNDISTSDLLNLVLTQRGNIDLQFQFWLTITFAVIVAAYSAGDRLDRRLRGVDIGIPWFAVYARMALMVLGTTAAVVFLVWRPWRRDDRR